MAMPHQAPNDVAAHAAKPDHTDLHSPLPRQVAVMRL
jgi:hypothetical protein